MASVTTRSGVSTASVTCSRLHVPCTGACRGGRPTRRQPPIPGRRAGSGRCCTACSTRCRPSAFPRRPGLLGGPGVLPTLVLALLVAWGLSQGLAYVGYLRRSRIGRRETGEAGTTGRAGSGPGAGRAGHARGRLRFGAAYRGALLRRGRGCLHARRVRPDGARR